MDQLPFYGREIFPALGPTAKLFAPDLEANASSILSTPRETFQYGSLPRQQLDVFSPASPGDTSGVATPVLVFFYGGGFVSGDRDHPLAPKGLVYANIGHFFSQRGFVTIVADYRLLSHGAKFPSGGEDVAGVVSWAKKHFGDESRELFLLGNSAGAVHLSTFMLSPVFMNVRDSVSSEKKSGLRWTGAILLSASFHYRSAPGNMMGILQAYFGEDIDEKSPMGLLKATPEAPVGAPQVLVMYTGLDPEDLVIETNKDFIKEWQNLRKGGLDVEVLPEHNHISPVFTLGTGKKDQEAWGELVADWMKRVGAGG
ncbi:hypothetical protein MMC24_006415 [Lignoscripta atroalba]|nr:hypothetical protein [Lignoscripta atroalba]